MLSGHPRICLVSASGENVFFGEILEAFGEALRERGFVVEKSVDCFPPLADDLVYLFIPHEYMALVDRLAHPNSEQLKRTVAVCTEQPGTTWFETSFEAAAQAGAAVDINRLATDEMNRRGIATAHIQLGYVPAWDVWRGAGERFEDREIDMAFLGRFTEERAAALARCVPTLERRQAAIYLTETIRPHVAGSAYYLAGSRRAELLARSKVLLNVHQQRLAYLEWHRILSAVLNGCVVLTEHSLMTEPLEPGRHFISARSEDLPLVLEGVLADPDRMEGIRRSAYEVVQQEMPMSAAAAVMIAAIERAARNPAGSGRPPAPSIPMPKKLADPKPGWETYAEQVGADLPMRFALKDLVVRVRSLERRIEELPNGKVRRNQVSVEQIGREIEAPRVSVLLTVFNHAHLVGTAIRSIAISQMPDVELIAVDDASADNSVEAIREACAEAPWLSTKLVRRSVNSGLPAASRNLALEHARGDLVFILDADNSVLPQGLAKLATALDDDREAAFAYGIIEKFDEGGPIGLESWLDWDPERLRHGNYIDAMAMIRRPALEAVGGYPTQSALAGWEDFGLWLAMAEAGMRGIRVPDFIGRYRVLQHSMLSVTNIDQSTAWNVLMRNYGETMRVGS